MGRRVLAALVGERHRLYGVEVVQQDVPARA